MGTIIMEEERERGTLKRGNRDERKFSFLTSEETKNPQIPTLNLRNIT